MKKYILLLTSLIICTAQAKETNPTKQWNKRYGIAQLPSSDKNDLASGLYYLLKEKGNKTTTPFSVNQFYKTTNNTCNYLCRNAYLKAYEKSVKASLDYKQKEQSWTRTLLPYYATVLSMLEDDDLTISFGSDRGKKLPATVFELDRALHPRIQQTTVVQMRNSGFSVHWQWKQL
jgi:hypothetical protein